MHDTAKTIGQAFFELYAKSGDLILDIGSYDVNGTLKPLIPEGTIYTGMDQAAGPNVNVIMEDPYKIPTTVDYFDIVVSSSCFEHAEFFWLLFVEMVRVVKPGGLIYVNAPSDGKVHSHPVDCWRFYPDSGLALQHWSERQGFPVTLIESGIAPRGSDGWSDFVAVWQKPGRALIAPQITKRIEGMEHVRP
jgi:SAM-dependent methyltransferase